MRKRKANPPGEMLVAILKEKSDFAILQEQGWYRIPVAHAPKRWPPTWLAFYQPKAFKEDAYRIRYYGQVADIQVVKRRELFPNEIPSLRSEQEYYRMQLHSLEEREQPIPSSRPRRLVFVTTTWEKFWLAEQINDLFDDSPMEDRLWGEFKKLSIGLLRENPGDDQPFRGIERRGDGATRVLPLPWWDSPAVEPVRSPG